MGKWEMGRAFQIEKDKTTINYKELVLITTECASQHSGNESEKDYFKAVTDSDFATEYAVKTTFDSPRLSKNFTYTTKISLWTYNKIKEIML